jgi:POT family proton-dependent oligopeptide transporter
MSWRSHPAATKILGGVALLHNFCFWGLASMFPFYATSRLEFSQARATSSYGLMLGVALAMPALGGLVVCRFAPQQHVRIAQAALLFLGGAALLLLVPSPNFTVGGGVLLALGYGLFWPTVVTMVSDAYDAGEPSTSPSSKRDDGFVMFYVVSTIGTFATQVLAGSVVARLDWTGFYVMLALAAVLGVVVLALATRRVAVAASANGAASKREALSPHERRRVLGVLLLALFCLVFWMGCSQMGGSVVFFAQNFVDRRVLGWEVPPTLFLSVFALFVVALAPLVAAVWHRLEDRGVPLSAPEKIAISIAFIAASFLLLSVAAQDLAPDGSQGVSAAVLLSFYVLQAVAVAILGPVGLSMVTRWAPDGWVERLTGVWFFSTGLGGLLGGYAAAAASSRAPSIEYGAFAVVLGAACIGLFATRHRIERLGPAEGSS